MIGFVGASALALLGLQASINAPRDAFRACLKSATDKATSEKVGGEAIEAYLRNACIAEGNSLRSAYVAVDVKNGMSRKAAASDADAAVDNYVLPKVDDYKFMADMNNPKPAAATTPAPTNASTPQPTPAAASSQPHKP